MTEEGKNSTEEDERSVLSYGASMALATARKKPQKERSAADQFFGTVNGERRHETPQRLACFSRGLGAARHFPKCSGWQRDLVDMEHPFVDDHADGAPAWVYPPDFHNAKPGLLQDSRE